MKQSTQQILISGCYRSGTDYTTQLLNNHPNLSASLHTTNFLRYSYNRFNPVNERYRELLENMYFIISRRWNKSFNIHNIISICDRAENVTYSLLYDLIMSDLYISDTTTSWAEKNQLVWRQIPTFLRMFPDGKAIHIIRDPRAVLASFKKYTYAPPPAYLGAVFNCYDSMLHALKYSEMYPKRFHTIRFEDIISQPEKTLTDTYKFLNLSHDHDLLSQKNWVDARGNPWVHNSSFAKNNHVDKSLLDKNWQTSLSKPEIAFCEKINNTLMDNFDYDRFYIFDDTYPAGDLTISPTIKHYLSEWSNGRGIQQFPTDPLDPKNWEENNTKVIQ